MAHNSEFDREIASFFLSYDKRKQFKAGDIVIQANDVPDKVYLLVSGHVKAYSIDKSGSIHLHMLFGPGKCFPLLRALKSKANQVCCQAIDEVELLVASVTDFQKAIQSNPAFTRALLDQSVQQFALFTSRIEDLQYSSARERLLYRLLSLAGDFGVPRESMVDIGVGLSHEELAASIQVSREVVTRLLRQFKLKSIIDYRRKSLSIRPELVLKELRDKNLSLSDFGL